MLTQQITNEPTESLSITTDGERFGLVHVIHTNGEVVSKVTVLSLREAQEIAKFIQLNAKEVTHA